MVETLKYLLRDSIDYAGLFPPAALGMREAVANHIRYKSGPEAWFVDRFVCGSTRIAEMESALNRMGYSDVFGITVVGSGGKTTADFLSNTIADIVGSRRVRHGYFEAFETRLPVDLLGASDLGPVVRRVRRYLEDEEFYVEIPFGPNWKNDVPKAIDEIKKTGAAKAKIRTVGITPQEFPTVEQVALFIYECARANLPFKATAGLHHPVRAYREETRCVMHGFLNVFVAAAIAKTFSPSLSVIEQVVGEEDADAFLFVQQRLRYGVYHLDKDKIVAARNFIESFGSCSVAEPLGDLEDLGFSIRSLR
jgi:hypothetical protein